MSCSYSKDPWIAIYDDPFANVQVSASVVRCTQHQIVDIALTMTYTLSSVTGQVKPQQKQHGPQRKGRGGKIKRW